MDFSNLIQYAVVGVGAIAISLMLTSWLQNRKPVEKAGCIVMKMPALYVVLSSILFVLFVLIESLIWFFRPDEFTFPAQIMFSAFGVFMCFGSINTLLLYLKHNVLFNDEYIVHTSWLGKTTTLKWTEIKRVSLSAISSSLQINGHGINIHVHQHIKGYKLFLEKVKEKTGLTLQ